MTQLNIYFMYMCICTYIQYTIYIVKIYLYRHIGAWIYMKYWKDIYQDVSSVISGW